MSLNKMGKSGNKRKKGHFRENVGFFSFLASLPPHRQKLLIRGADRPILHALSEVCLNILRRNVELSPMEKKRLKHYADQIYQLSLKKHNLSQRKHIAQKGGFLSALLTGVLPVLLSTVISAATGK